MWYYVTPAGEKAEAPNDDLPAAVNAGLVTRETLVWQDGMVQWQPAGQAQPSLFPTAQPSVPAAATELPPPLANRSTPGLTIASFVCGLVSFTGLSILTGIPAVILGHMALKLYREEPDRYEGRGLAVAGLVLGYVRVAVLFVIVMFAGLSAAPSR